MPPIPFAFAKEMSVMPVFISIQLPFCLYLKDDDYPEAKCRGW
jgi:hypothetical protein